MGVFLGGTVAANELDDYEEGTWTPASTFANDTASNQVGKYTKIGNLVIASFQIIFSTTSFAVTVSISGLPFTATNTPSGPPAIGIGGAMIKGYYTGTSTNLSGYVGDGTTQINLYENSTHLQHNSDKILGKNLRATVVYQTN